MTVSRTKFEEAVNLLRPYVDTSTESSLVGALLGGGSDPAAYYNGLPTDKKIEALAEELVSMTKGGVFVSEFEEKLDSFTTTSESNTSDDAKTASEKISQFVRITHAEVTTETAKKPYVNSPLRYKESKAPETSYSLKGGGLLEGNVVIASTVEKMNDPNCKKLYAVELMNPRLGMTTRDSAPLSIFTSQVNTLEMSRCVPYINVKINISGSSPVTPEGNLQGISLITYLNGSGSPKGTYDNLYDLTMLQKKPDADDYYPNASMEIFTSPQTLVSPPDSAAFNPPQGYSRVLDRFRPYMSLESLSFTVAPTNGWLSYKSGQMSLTLHDRSRLSQIAPFIKPDIYQGTEFDIEYGWSHPAGNSNTEAKVNPIGVFLEGLRVREKYAIVNSSFSFEEGGQVKITLSLAMKSVPGLQNLDISLCKAKDTSASLKSITEAISKQIDIVKGREGDKFSKLYDETILNAVGTDSSSLSLDAEAMEELNVKLAALKNSKSADKQLVDLIDKLLGKGGAVEQFKKSVDDAVNEQITDLTGGVEIFPCTDGQAKGAVKDAVLGNDIGETASDSTVSKPISFGRLLLAMVGKPLANSGLYDEIQFIFHTFNEYASFMRDLSIAKFPIPKADLESKLKEVLKENLKLSCMQMAQMLIQEFIADPSAVPYGFRQLYQPAKDEDGKPTGGYERISIDTDDEKLAEEERIYQADMENYILAKAGIPNGRFRLPKISIYPECIPANSNTSKSILRMHVIDDNASSFGTTFDLMKASRGGDLSAFGLMNNPEHPLLKIAPEIDGAAIEKSRKELFLKMIDSKVIVPLEKTANVGEKQSTEKEYEVDIGKIFENNSVDKVKRMVSEGLPTILYGRNSGMVTSAGVTSLNDPQLATVNMMRMSKASSTTPELSRNRGLPMRIAPTEVSLEMLGMPIAQFMQYVFVDFSTGTTADNIYAITGIDHKISAGEFTTSLKLVAPADAYAEFEAPKKKLEMQSQVLKNALGIEDSGESKIEKPKRSSTLSSAVKASKSGSSSGGGGGGGGGGSGVNSKPNKSKEATDAPEKFYDLLGFSPAQLKLLGAKTMAPGGCVIKVDYVKKKVIDVYSEDASDTAKAKAIVSAKASPTETNTAFLWLVGIKYSHPGGLVHTTIYSGAGVDTPIDDIKSSLSTWLGQSPFGPHRAVGLNVGTSQEWKDYLDANGV